MPFSRNTKEFETEILVNPYGFREYDARWRFPEDINLRGFQVLGLAMATLFREEGAQPKVVTGHDYRSYSGGLKQALIIGLMQGGCDVRDIGLCTTPAAYYAQFALDCPCVAMVTASHNENGWTGVKMGAHRPLTFGPELMTRLRRMVADKTYRPAPGGSYAWHGDIGARYLDDLAQGRKITRRLKAVVACGNGTAALFAPEALRRIGCEVIEQDCTLDYTFPHVNPNPEDMAMLHRLQGAVLENKADIGFAFDGDGDRCGVVADDGREIFADKMGVLLARHFSTLHEKPRFVADVKSTGLYAADPELKRLGAETDYWITGHSYIKRRVQELGALAGFEKSGHFFFNAPIGRGYDDGILSAIAICRMLDAHKNLSMAQLYETLPRTWSSPTMSPHCPDETKYDVVKAVTRHYQDLFSREGTLLGRKIAAVVTVNGVRIVLDDGTWGLIRASSNKPCLVVVVESPVSEACMKDMFRELHGTLNNFESVGEYDQKLTLVA